VVGDTKTLDELLIKSTCDIIMSPGQLRAQRRSFVYGNDITRDIVVRADADFERIFGSE
jgi:hypothetical protein